MGYSRNPSAGHPRAASACDGGAAMISYITEEGWIYPDQSAPFGFWFAPWYLGVGPYRNGTPEWESLPGKVRFTLSAPWPSNRGLWKRAFLWWQHQSSAAALHVLDYSPVSNSEAPWDLIVRMDILEESRSEGVN